jgi:hypothetical protein
LRITTFAISFLTSLVVLLPDEVARPMLAALAGYYFLTVVEGTG